MSRLVFKLIAAFTMLLDHFAFIFLDSDTTAYWVLRGIGRVSFVMFAYLIAQGFHKTSNKIAYLMRLGLFAIVIEIFLIGYYLIGGDNFILTFNIMWVLLLGLLSLYLFFHKNNYLKLLVFPIIIGAELLNLSYGAYGVLIIYLFGIYQNKATNLLCLGFLNLMFINDPLYSFLGMSEVAKFPAIQWLSMFAIVLIFIYNGQMGRYKWKWFFYLFYPGHLVLLYLIKNLFF